MSVYSKHHLLIGLERRNKKVFDYPPMYDEKYL